MKGTSRYLYAFVCGALLVAGAPRAGRAAPSRQELDERPHVVDGRVLLPAWETTWERQARLRKDSSLQLIAFRNSHPELYAVTEPPVAPVHFFAEYEPVDAIYYAWYPGWLNDFYGQMTQELLTRTTISVNLLHHGAQERALVESLLTGQGTDPSLVSFIDMSTLGDYYIYQNPPEDRALESIWMVDYGPYWVEDGAGTLSIVDPRYYFWRINDDAVPAKLGAQLGVNVFRPDLNYEGGNLFSDGLGTCFATGAHVIANARHAEAEIDDMMRAYFGCEKMIWLWPMYGEGTGHIDMFFKNASATTLVLGEYDAALDPDNAAVLEYNAALLADETNAAGEPFEVLRIPMPDNSDGNFRSYTNGIIVNDLHLVPTYADHALHEAEALAVFEQAFPGKTIVGIDSEEIIQYAGAIHCVTRTRPVGTLQQMEAPPAEACGGASDCIDDCGALDEVGSCLYGSAARCRGASMEVDVCAPGEQCGWDLYEDHFGCTTQSCAAVQAEGLCREIPELGIWVAMTCSEEGFPEGARCAEGEECGVLSTTGRVGCREPCDDECRPGETGCDGAGVALGCGEADDGDTCWEALRTECAEDQTCQEGACVCVDQCALGEAGCDADGNAWVCGEAGDGDECTDRVVTACSAGTRCQDAACVATESSGCGCQTKGPGIPIGSILLLLGLMFLRWRR